MFELKAFRTGRSLTQQEMANAMGVPLRTYEDLEAGRSQVRTVHERAAKYGAWLVRNPGKVSETANEFFVVRFRYNGNADWSEPWTVWAADFPMAIDRFYNLGNIDDSSELQVKHMDPKKFISELRHTKSKAEAVFRHPDARWPEIE